MTIAFVTASTSGRATNVFVCLAGALTQAIHEMVTLVSSAGDEGARTVIVREVSVASNGLIAFAGSKVGIEKKIDEMDVEAEFKARSHAIPDWAAMVIVCGLALALTAFFALWMTDSKIPAVLMPVGLAMAAIGFWRADRAMQPKD